MTVLEAGFDVAHGESVGDWHPARYTPPLTGAGTETFRTDGDRLIKFALKHWRLADLAVGARFVLDEWQAWLIRHVLERYPDDWPVVHLRGHLRFRQVVISMGRQNGKSLLGALFAIYLLALHVRGPRVIGLASVDRQAKIVYKRVKYAVDNNPALARDIRTTETRGIHRRDGSGVYDTLPANVDAVQGEPGTGILYDELHLGVAGLWDAMVKAMQAKPNAMMIGITTAGDDDSKLLIRLYAEGELSIAGDPEAERFGFFCWEATDNELTEANVIAANPAVASGRVPLDTVMADARAMMRRQEKDEEGLTGPQNVQRYTLNRFLEGSTEAWVPLPAWTDLTADVDLGAGEVIYAVERTGEWEWASITATARTDAGEYVTELVASIATPTHDALVKACRILARSGRAVFAMPRTTLGKVAKTLTEDHGLTVYSLTSEEEAQAAQTTKAAITGARIHHPGDPLLRHQMIRARRRDTGETWRLSRSLSVEHIDAVIATVAGVLVAETRAEHVIQLW